MTVLNGHGDIFFPFMSLMCVSLRADVSYFLIGDVCAQANCVYGRIN